MESQVRITVRSILVATAIVAFWCLLCTRGMEFAAAMRTPHSHWPGWVVACGMMVLPATAVGALVGRTVLATLCGLASFAGFAVIVLQGYL
jgi:hypothetical protein